MRIIDVIDHSNVMDDELAYREPQQGSGDWRMGSQLIVGENQAAIFVRAGQALDVFGPGRHVLSVANLPILSSLIGLATSGRTPFTADVYFINLKDMPQVPWGTVKPIYLNVTTGLGILLLRTHGVIDISVADPMLFLKQYAIGKPITRLRDIKDRIQTMLLGEINGLMLKSGADSLVAANGILEEVEGALLAQVNERFAAMGLQIKAFEANPFDTVNVPIEELRDIVPLEVWLNVLERQKRLDMGMAAAQNPGLGGAMAGAGVGLGVGQQLGQMMNPDAANMQQQMMQNQQMMQQLMMQQLMDKQGGAGGSAPAQTAAPQTKADVQALIDGLDLKLMNGEISEATYNNLVAKWQAKMDQMDS
jgi:membrane protease subunit (stomatin/prohibitin family)